MDIIELLKNPEGKTLEFKRDISSPQGIIRTFVAFANTAGGTLVIGIEDKTRNILGVPEPLAIEEKIANLISDSIAPLILPDIEVIHYKQTQVIGVHIHPSSARPHYLKSKGLEDGTYIRIGSTNRKADISLIRELQRYASNQSYDEQPFIGLQANAINSEVVSKTFEPFRHLKPSDFETLRLIVNYQGKKVPTNAGILLFGKNREEHFPDAWIQAGRFMGMDKSEKIRDTQEIRSYPTQAIEEAMQFVQKHSNVSYDINSVKRNEIWSIPHQAVREAIINAVTHADYSQSGSPIRISIFEDRLEIENPGLLQFGLTIEDILKGISKLRNRIIGRIFNELKLVEKWGTGIQRINKACKEMGLLEPKFEEIGTHFRVTIYTQVKEKPTLDSQDQIILNILKNANGMSTHDIANMINLSTRTTRNRLSKLLEKGLIFQISNSTNDPTKLFFFRKNKMIMSQSEYDDYIKLLHEYGYSETEFVLFETDHTTYKEGRISPVNTTVTIKNLKNGKSKTYYSGHGSTWHSELEMDFKTGVFK